MNTKLQFILFIFLPFLIGGTTLGCLFGALGYFLSFWFGLFETVAQHEMVFWLFAGMGLFGGTVGAIQSLIVFLKQPSPE